MTKVAKWGNSVAVRIPEEVARDARVREGTAVELSVESGAIVMRRAKKERHSLKDLVKRIRPHQLHAEEDWGAPVGREVW